MTATSRSLPAESHWLRAEPAVGSSRIGVDREQNRINGFVVAERGPFKTPGRGEFDSQSLQRIVELGNAAPNGLKSRFTHPDLSNDGLGKFLGRATNFRQEGDKVRADLQLDSTSLDTPPEGGRPLGEYVLELAASDPAAFSSSLVLTVDREFRLNDDGTRQKDEDGNPLPPLWRPLELHATDVVDTGDAVNDFLSTNSFPDDVVRQASQLIDRQFSNLSRDVVEARLTSYINRYLDNRFGEPEMTEQNQTAQLPKEFADQLAAQGSQLEAQGKVLEQLTTMMTGWREDQQKQLERETRAETIVAKCKMANKPELADAFIADEALSAEHVTDKLLSMMCEDRGLASDGERGELDGDAKLSREFLENEKIHKKLGVTQEAYLEFSKGSGNKKKCTPIEDGAGCVIELGN